MNELKKPLTSLSIILNTEYRLETCEKILSQHYETATRE